MDEEKKIKLFLVDDDLLYLKMLEIELLQHADFIIESYPTGELCVANLANKPDLIILDYYLNGIDRHAINGLETLDKITAFDPEIPVVMLSAQDKIEVAVNCMKHQAYDYVVKSETAFTRLRKIINTVFRYKKMEKTLEWYMERM